MASLKQRRHLIKAHVKILNSVLRFCESEAKKKTPLINKYESRKTKEKTHLVSKPDLRIRKHN